MDIDFAAFVEEYKPKLLEHLQSNETKFYLRRKFGKVNDSYEFTLTTLDGSRPMMDLFWLYSAANESWVGGTSSDGTKYKYTYPRITDICAADLLGHIFWIPCDPELILKTEYGPQWYKDHPTSRFSWSSSHYNVKKNGKWTSQEMKEVYKTRKDMCWLLLKTSVEDDKILTRDEIRAKLVEMCN
ncbi:unnamed protein product [Strongylus vulgaris]|uniref:Uncharacterized protein n=1 Tax=Strongylus vulgaris TaxID=40348 RepID=A0A3P7JCU9_STRVU|nr:unnamed protein product [Strongylus vulgaris]